MARSAPSVARAPSRAGSLAPRLESCSPWPGTRPTPTRPPPPRSPPPAHVLNATFGPPRGRLWRTPLVPLDKRKSGLLASCRDAPAHGEAIALPPSEARAPARVFVFLLPQARIGQSMYFAYLDEFGHIGRYISRDHARHNDSPIFGLAGYVIPAAKVRCSQRGCSSARTKCSRRRSPGRARSQRDGRRRAPAFTPSPT